MGEKRKIIKIDEKKCNGCGLCIPNCPEGAIRIIDKKARLVSDLCCDGLGACLGHCPQGAISIEEREAEPYDEERVMAYIVTQGKNVVKAHLQHLKEHSQNEYLAQGIEYLRHSRLAHVVDEFLNQDNSACHGRRGPANKEALAPQGCPGSKVMDSRHYALPPLDPSHLPGHSRLQTWPIQLTLVPALAPFFNDAHLLFAADCVPFAYAGFHEELLKGRTLLVGCPKLDDKEAYRQKLKQIIANNNIKSITYAHMEVPCCYGLLEVFKDAITDSGKDIPFHDVTIGIKGERKS